MNTPYYYYYYLYKNNRSLLLSWLFIISAIITHAQSNQLIIDEYLLKGEKEKALIVYNEMINKGDKTMQTHNRCLALMLSMGEYSEAERYIKKRIQQEGRKTKYLLDMGLVAIKEGKQRKAEAIFNSIAKNKSTPPYQVRTMINYFTQQRLFDYAIQTILRARKTQSDPLLYALDMGYLYRIKNDKKAMVEEYLNLLASGNMNNINYIKNVFQTALEEDSMYILENLIYERIQQNPTIELYQDLLIWANLQRHDFFNAYVKAKAYDRRFSKQRSKTLEVARIALRNEDFDTANKGFTYVIQQSAIDAERIKAQLGRIKAHTEKLKKMQTSKNNDSIRWLIDEYQSVIQEHPNSAEIDEAILSQAKLYAYELLEEAKAIDQLNRLIKRSVINPFTKAKAKLELGTLYMIQGQPWESALLYAQVAHDLKGTPIGDEAKLRNARLYYYNGDFKLAQDILNILKEATTREIANDALELSFCIKENTMIDSIGHRLKEYAAIERLLEEHRPNRALEKLVAMEKKCEEGINKGNLADRAILDDVFWLEAKIRLQRNEWQKACILLQQIVERFGEDVLADDALFLRGKIKESHQQKKEAKETYFTLIHKFPGSVYVDEARKRYRILNREKNLNP